MAGEAITDNFEANLERKSYADIDFLINDALGIKAAEPSASEQPVPYTTSSGETKTALTRQLFSDTFGTHAARVEYISDHR